MKMTGFADEISKNLAEQLDILNSEGIRHLELRSAFSKNVLQLTDEEVRQVKSALDQAGIRVSAIGSPIGKYDIGEDFEVERERIARAIAIAGRLEAPFIRVFSYYIPKGEPPEAYRSEVMRRMKELARMAAQGGVTLVMENESGVYGDTAERCLDILESCDSGSLRLAFDPGNFVRNGVQPVSEAYPRLSSYLAYVHIKDAERAGGKFVPFGHGDGECAELIRRLKADRYSGFLSIEPHLHAAYPEESDAKRFRIAAKALKQVLDAESVAWN